MSQVVVARRLHLRTAAVVAVVCWALLAVAGTVIAARVVGRATSPPKFDAVRATGIVEPGRAPAQVGESVRTSFGVVAVENVQRVDGLTDKSLAGASHGISGLVQEGKAQIQVAIDVTNLSRQPLEWAPTQFELLVRQGSRTSTLHPTGGSVAASVIQPDAAVEGHIDFVVPLDGSRMQVRFTDPGTRRPVLVDAGSVPVRQPSSTHQHH